MYFITAQTPSKTAFDSPSRSAPSSTSPMSPVPAEDSSSNRDSVLRSNAMFSMPLVGVLEKMTCVGSDTFPPDETSLKNCRSCCSGYLQALYPMRSMSSSGVDSMMSCTSVLSSFSGKPAQVQAAQMNMCVIGLFLIVR